MPKIVNFHSPNIIIFELNLVNNHLFDYNKCREDYLNWIPIDLKLYEENQVYTFPDTPTLSIEGLKDFIQCINNLFFEKKQKDSQKVLMNLEHYEIFEYFATEAEFHVSFQNTCDQFDEDIVTVTFWFHTWSCKKNLLGYQKGFRFWVSLKKLESFLVEINAQLYDLTNGNEGKPRNKANKNL